MKHNIYKAKMESDFYYELNPFILFGCLYMSMERGIQVNIIKNIK